MTASAPLSLRCTHCLRSLERQMGRAGDPVLWCPHCQRGWLPGTAAFDRLLEAQKELERRGVQPKLFD
ncbi:hypothetical protein HNR42_001583 [Deinobacterium chartae]|uniref:Uncharacterized protein n=1 Tax=Deinobacterium chartae TaxID=521158 RepID=A0A841I1I0_9DEIO|nr:hypothetical protein [Deinobacterium chartae]MBB6098158.1 hypothetical protein [Deinobacterium chartae]